MEYVLYRHIWIKSPYRNVSRHTRTQMCTITTFTANVLNIEMSAHTHTQTDRVSTEWHAGTHTRTHTRTDSAPIDICAYIENRRTNKQTNTHIQAYACSGRLNERTKETNWTESGANIKWSEKERCNAQARWTKPTAVKCIACFYSSFDFLLVKFWLEEIYIYSTKKEPKRRENKKL